MPNLIKLKNTTSQAEAAYGSFASAALLCTIGSSAGPEGQITFKHLGTAGYWYIKLLRTTGPTTTVYSKKLAPGEPWTERNPPIGDVYALADANVNGNLSWYMGWNQ